MLLSHTDPEERTEMLSWLNSHYPKFLFDSNARINYGFTPFNVDWRRDDIRIDDTCRCGPFIDFAFTLRTYGYPHMLAHILRNADWKIKARFREMRVDTHTPWKDMRFSGPWTRLDDPDFPLGWSAGADRRRQIGTVSI